jgi:YVTN family beta-propeller protein
LHFTPDGRFGFTPERDQDTVSKIDLASRAIVKSVTFPAGSKPYMLRVSRDGKEVWVQTAAANTNVVLNADDLSTLATEPVGRSAITNAWSPDGRYSLITHANDNFVSVFDATTYREIKRVDVGGGSTSLGFTKDGKTAFISVTAANTVAVIDLARLEVIDQLRAGQQPQGLIVL